MNISVHIPFNEEVYREQAQIQFNIAIDQNKDTVRNYLIFILGGFLLGSFFLFIVGTGGALIAGMVLILAGLIYLLVYLNYQKNVQKHKTIYEQNIQKEVNRLNQNNQPIELKLTDEHFSYNDGDIGSSMRWTLFNSYILKDDFIFLVLNKGTTFSAYFVHESQIGQEAFREVKQFVVGNLKPYANKHRYSDKKPKANPELIDN